MDSSELRKSPSKGDNTFNLNIDHNYMPTRAFQSYRKKEENIKKGVHFDEDVKSELINSDSLENKSLNIENSNSNELIETRINPNYEESFIISKKDDIERISKKTKTLTINQSPPKINVSPNRVKSKTLGSNSKQRNSKLLIFSKLIDPLDEIDHEKYEKPDITSNNTKDLVLSSYEYDEIETGKRFCNFHKARLDDLKIKILDEIPNTGKYTYITVI